MFKTRFAPSPTGPLHLGHAYSAIVAYDMAQAAGGEFILRIEDIDKSRVRPQWEAKIYEDLHWLGLRWPMPVLHQSDRQPAYDDALARLTRMGVTYPCLCNRRDIEQAASAPQEGVALFGPDGRLYPGTCRQRKMDDKSQQDTIRLNMGKSLDIIDLDELLYVDSGQGNNQVHRFSAEDILTTVGDIILVRRDMGSSYHLSVVVDDAAQNITHVVRGRDLAEATKIHVVLQRLLDLPTPIYHHHRLIRDENGKRLAKRDDARALAKFRADGATPREIRALVGQ